MSPRLDQFLFDEANAKSAAWLRVLFAATAALIFYPREGSQVSSLLQTPWTQELYSSVLLTPAYWGVTMVLLAAFALGRWPRATGLLAVLLLAPCVPVQAALAGRYMIWFAVAALSLLRGRSTESVGPVWPIRLIQIQLSVLYFVNAAAKTSAGYLSGDALATMAQQLPNFHVDLSGGSFPLADLALPLWLAATASAAMEYGLAIGFWFRRLRWFTAAVGVLFHVGLASVVTITYLDVAAVCLYAAFLLNPVRLRGAEPT